MLKNLKLKLYGRVQGVGYRDAAYWKARKLGVAGFIMNEPDESVYIEAEADEVVLNEFLTWCRSGPWTAKVERVEVAWGEAAGKFTGFRVG
jgi:acylphosphatase